MSDSLERVRRVDAPPAQLRVVAPIGEEVSPRAAPRHRVADFRRRIRQRGFLSEAAQRRRVRRRSARVRFLIGTVGTPLMLFLAIVLLALGFLGATAHPGDGPSDLSVANAPPALPGNEGAQPVGPPWSWHRQQPGLWEYTIRKHDNLWTVVKRERNIQGDALPPVISYVKQLNGIDDVRALKPGERIVLPSREELIHIARLNLRAEGP